MSNERRSPIRYSPDRNNVSSPFEINLPGVVEGNRVEKEALKEIPEMVLNLGKRTISINGHGRQIPEERRKSWNVLLLLARESKYVSYKEVAFAANPDSTAGMLHTAQIGISSLKKLLGEICLKSGLNPDELVITQRSGNQKPIKYRLNASVEFINGDISSKPLVLPSPEVEPPAQISNGQPAQSEIDGPEKIKFSEVEIFVLGGLIRRQVSDQRDRSLKYKIISDGDWNRLNGIVRNRVGKVRTPADEALEKKVKEIIRKLKYFKDNKEEISKIFEEDSDVSFLLSFLRQGFIENPDLLWGTR